ncbi:MAG: ECF transporter S component [Ruminiclostridium sp.]|nr:ECF transporter S component [Ruminiclostridium sp.]
MKKTTTLEIVQTALFAALVAVLAFVPYVGYIRIPVLAIQATTVHIPVIVGSIALGPKRGAILGGIFGLTSLINNTASPGLTSFVFSPFVEIGDGMGGSPLSLIICFIPRILVGVVPYYVYTALQKRSKAPEKRRKFSLLLAGVAGSMTNTILVMGLIFVIFGHEYAAAREIAYEAILGVILSTVAINGTIEAIVAALITSAVVFALYKSKFIKSKNI